MVIRQKLQFLSVLLLSSCSINQILDDSYAERFKSKGLNNASIYDLQSEKLKNAPRPKVKPVVAIYPTSFTDQTGQRKSNSEFALFSTAITQAPNSLLIRALKHASNGEFFTVAERIGLDNLTKERQIIRSTREQFTKNQEEIQPLMPLLFAGVLLEGAVVSYDSNVRTGGAGARYLGIGTSIQYREDIVSVSLRLIIVATGEVLIEIMSKKTLFSYGQSQDVFKFINDDAELIEIEVGASSNESSTLALMKAIEEAVYNLIIIGYDKGFWTYEENIN